MWWQGVVSAQLRGEMWESGTGNTAKERLIGIAAVDLLIMSLY